MLNTLFALVLVAGLAGTAAAADCPAAVKTAIDKAFPKATISTCTAEKEHGRDQFEVVLVKHGGGKAEVDVAPDGKILVVEEPIPMNQVPAAVMKAFAAKYPKAKATRAEKETETGGKPKYELGFEASGTKKEATFAEDGTFVEEE